MPGSSRKRPGQVAIHGPPFEPGNRAPARLADPDRFSSAPGRSPRPISGSTPSAAARSPTGGANRRSSTRAPSGAWFVDRSERPSSSRRWSIRPEIRWSALRSIRRTAGAKPTTRAASNWRSQGLHWTWSPKPDPLAWSTCAPSISPYPSATSEPSPASLSIRTRIERVSNSAARPGGLPPRS